MNELALFNYGDKTVRTVILEGQIWFVAKDVADILEFRDAYNATQCLEDNEKGTCKVSTLRGEQEMLIINEPGIYCLIFRSNKPEAKAFQDWVYHDVLPTLHHKGSFTIIICRNNDMLNFLFHCRQKSRQNTIHAAQFTIQRQFPNKCPIVQ